MDVEQIISDLRTLYPQNFFYLRHDPFYVLISTVLSHRTRDEITYRASSRLMDKFRSAQEMAEAEVSEIEELIKDVGFYRVKSRRVKEIAEILMYRYGGEVPDNCELLLELPGVGRKTANCVLLYAFSKETIAVDTHVHRISNRLGLVKSSTPDETEEKLKKILPRSSWKDINELFVQFGQNICRPVSPKCDICVLCNICPGLF
ncbi:DNA-(apurinic or apyrimidinic site) lyase [Methanosalsum zhilinae DSM 4017]|uniref:Endonuclease III n=1 Tax=Methanosalsum zhilinae (strain DSM 4017 / NBRC 107636 / OCM 62 / WeN5) TaxID=679901 RepID=F7XNN4_METZD|nr:endonuclease III [Methanosalsum zhilinae]AEH60138.1 DNA-(apurinic or apyrimidinic site) lyase [Methanosalsum zhilinae DSM 4017]